MSMVVIIHPKDISTNFLNSIWMNQQISEIDNLKIFNIDHTAEAHCEVYNFLKNCPVDSKIIFLGHGCSFSLHGAKNDVFSYDVFISKDNVHHFNLQNLLCLSCKSSEFLKSFANFNYIGFGDLPTEMAEIRGLREAEFNIYKDVDDEIIEEFKNIIVSIISNSIFEWVDSNLDIQNLYHRIKIRIMREICILIDLDKESFENRKGLFELLIDMKASVTYKMAY